MSDAQIGPEDLILQGVDGKIYWIKKETYQQVLLPEPQSSVVRLRIQDGAVLSNIPNNSIGTGTACYLLNLKGLRPIEPSEHSSTTRANSEKLNKP